MRASLLPLPLLVFLAWPAAGDEIGDAIGEARRAWGAGDTAAAKSALEEALQLLAQRAAAGLGDAMPAPLPGWTVGETETSALAALGMFGGTTAKRDYRNAARQRVSIQIVADSPMIASLGMVMANPAMAGGMGRLVRVGTQRAIVTKDNEVQMLVDNRILVTIDGTAPLEAKLAYAQAVDVARLAQRR